MRWLGERKSCENSLLQIGRHGRRLGRRMPAIGGLRGLVYNFQIFNKNINNSFVPTLTVFADLYNFLKVWRSSSLTVHEPPKAKTT